VASDNSGRRGDCILLGAFLGMVSSLAGSLARAIIVFHY
jgi:hypothetical protein